MRKTVLAATAIALSLPAVVAQAGSFDGIYVGANVGGAFASIDETDSSPVYNGGSHRLQSHAANGVVGGVFGGYGHSFGQFYLGGEVDATFGNREYSDEYSDPYDPLTQKIKTGTEWGMSFRPGYAINPNALIYGLLGFEQVPLKSTTTGNDITFNKTQTGFRLGLGTEVALWGPVTLRADYTHTFLDDITLSDGLGDSVVYKPSEDKFKLGIAYHF